MYKVTFIDKFKKSYKKLHFNERSYAIKSIGLFILQEIDIIVGD